MLARLEPVTESEYGATEPDRVAPMSYAFRGSRTGAARKPDWPCTGLRRQLIDRPAQAKRRFPLERT